MNERCSECREGELQSKARGQLHCSSCGFVLLKKESQLEGMGALLLRMGKQQPHIGTQHHCALCAAEAKSFIVGAGEAVYCESCKGIGATPRALADLEKSLARNADLARNAERSTDESSARTSSISPSESRSTGSADATPRRSVVPVGELLEVEFESPFVWSGVLALLFVVVTLLSLTSLGSLLFVFPRMMIHELGHAIPSWLSSRAALPLPCGITFHSEHKSIFTGLCVAFLLGVLGVGGFREERRAAVVVASVLGALWVLCTFVLNSELSLELITWAGCGGEMIIPSILFALFHARLPTRLRWDFMRLFVVPVSFASYASAMLLWIGVARGTERMPRGTFLGTGGDGAGDLDRLIGEYGWSESYLLHFFLVVGVFSAIAALSVHLFIAYQVRLRVASGD